MNNTAHYNREGTQSCPSTKNWIKVFLSMAPPIRIWPSFPHSQSLPSGSFHKPLILIPQRADQMKPTVTKTNEIDHMTTALSKSIKLLTMPCSIIQDRRVMVESSDKIWPTGDGKSKPLQYSCLENPKNSTKRHKDMTLKVELPMSVSA